ncbi:hypothetical protein KY366_01835 [Candidatus Woesearchaeota archaeon]|nr:hypothetical protein [Candidatus Woesearchaeota archaeon]
MAKYRIDMDVLRKGKVRPQIGKVLVLSLDGGRQLEGKITQIGRDSIIMTKTE